MQLRKAEQEIVTFNKGEINITDPGYDSDVWCRFNTKIKAGRYIATAWKGAYREKNRIFILSIIHEDYQNERLTRYELLGKIGVDAGLAGFFEDKPDYNEEEWTKFCDAIYNKDFAITTPDNFGGCNGVFSSSGYGDGTYLVYARRNKDGEIVNLEIRF